MTWVFWAFLSALFAAGTALLAKVGVEGVDSNLATAIRTSVILVFTWGIAMGLEKHNGLSEIGRRSWLFSGAVRRVHGIILALLFSRPADGTRIERRASR
jgi:uncharacterized membrane protein